MNIDRTPKEEYRKLKDRFTAEGFNTKAQENNRVTVKLQHFSKYGVMSYEKRFAGTEDERRTNSDKRRGFPFKNTRELQRNN